VTERDTGTLSDDEILTTGTAGETQPSGDDDSTDADTGDDADDMDADTDDTDA
jgi:hypothetical protein